jgi:hypothetical protein
MIPYVALALAIVAVPALADLSPEVGAAIDICIAPGPDVPARVAALVDAGWSPVTEANRQTASLALSPYHLIARMSVIPGQTPLERLELLTDSANSVAADAERFADSTGYALLLAPGGAAMIVQVRLDNLGACTIAAPITPADLGSRTDAVLQDNTGDVLHQTRLQIADNDDVFLYTYLSGTFGATDPLPLFVTPFAIAN